MSEILIDTKAQLDALIRETGAVINPPLVKSWYAPYRARQRTDGVERRTGMAYGSDERQKLDVYLPTAVTVGGRGRRPLIVFMHGGGFIRGDRSERDNVGWRFAREGFVTVIPSYRLAPAHRWPAGAEDVASVWAWAHEQADALEADPSQIFIVGESAGAAHAAAATLIRRFRHDAVHAPAGVALISGVYNAELEYIARRQFGTPTPDPRNDAYFGDDAASRRQMSTVELIDVPSFPLLITWAELDPPQMQIQAGELFAKLSVRHGFSPDIQVIAGHNHLSQLEAINTVDDQLSSTIIEFLLRCQRA